MIDGTQRPTKTPWSLEDTNHKKTENRNDKNAAPKNKRSETAKNGGLFIMKFSGYLNGVGEVGECQSFDLKSKFSSNSNRCFHL